jgi:predicted DNA-binding transcriptional regulator AlpA
VSETIFLSVADLSKRWNQKPQVIYGLRHRGEAPPAIRIGRELRWRLSDIEAWENARLENANQ